jgi:hypothetical protein
MRDCACKAAAECMTNTGAADIFVDFGLTLAAL